MKYDYYLQTEIYCMYLLLYFSQTGKVLETKDYKLVSNHFVEVDRPKAALCFGSLVSLDVVCRYLSLFLLYMKLKIGKK